MEYTETEEEMNNLLLFRHSCNKPALVFTGGESFGEINQKPIHC
jgi:hypothetical protein